MKKVISVVLVVLMLVTVLMNTGCDAKKVPTYVDVLVTKQPVGGTNINSLSCSYNATWRFEIPENADTHVDKPSITVTAVWVNDKGAEYNEQTQTLGENEASGTFTISYAPKTAGQYFDKTFWVRVTWSDSAGSHTLTSSKAVCTVK